MNRNRFLLSVFLFSFFLQKSDAQSSVLASGDWYKMAVSQEGIYCITYSDLTSFGINVTAIDPRNISIYGNKAGMLPMQNYVPHINDLLEMAIKINGEADGVFDPGDTIFLYGQSPVQIIADTINNLFSHQQNFYSDSICYFLTIGSVPGKRISNITSLPSFSNSTTSYTDFEWHELDSINFLHSGKAWYGEIFLPHSSRIFNIDTAHIAALYSVNIKTKFVGRVLSNANSYFNLVFNGNALNTSIQSTSAGTSSNYVNPASANISFHPPIASGILEFDFQSPDSSARCWLDYFEINMKRNLYLFKPQQIISDLHTIGTGIVTRYNIDNAISSTNIWDVTDPVNVANQQFNSFLPLIDFNSENDFVHRYIAFDGHTYLTPTFIGQIPNQNLHAVSQANLIIVTAPQFINEATTLGNFHQSHDGLQSTVVTTDQVYNEYSTGIKDPVGIRDFVRQVFKRSAASNDSLKYLLLFGGASYDYKDHLGFHADLVPTFESDGSINLTQTTDIENYFGLMNDSAGGTTAYWSDIGIGRLPVRNSVDASIVNKIINYSSSSTLGNWRKKITVVADDEDVNTHLNQMEAIVNGMENQNCEFNYRKIYLDAYVKNFSGLNPTYPLVNTDLEYCVQNGSLIIEYIGHGDIQQWAEEDILHYQFIQSVLNNSNLPLFVSTTCAYNVFDDPAFVSIGQNIALRDSGGGIASIGSSRLAFSSSNFNFIQKLQTHILAKENNNYLRLGDIFKKTEQDNYFDPYIYNVSLLGDPAVKLNYPDNKVATTAINGQATSAQLDTLLPGQFVRIDGEVEDNSGNLLSNFNGTIDVLMYDRPSLHYTLANDSNSNVAPFYAYDDTLHFATVPVINGIFTDTFYLPYSVDSGFGIGKISYYAQNGITDASSCYENIGFKNLHAGINELQGANVSVFPNPSQDKIEISIEGVEVSNFELSVFDVAGRIILKNIFSENKIVIDKKYFSAGTYFYEVKNRKNQQVKHGKIVFE